MQKLNLEKILGNQNEFIKLYFEDINRVNK